MLKRTTLYLDSKLHQAIKMKSVQTHISLSKLINDAIKLSLKEDATDLKSIKEREQESYRSYEDVLKDLKRDGLL